MKQIENKINIALNNFNSFFSNQKAQVVELYKIIGFGLLSLLMGKIQFYLPGIEGSVSDFREIGLIIGVFYFRHWIPIIFVSLITSIGTPPDGSVLSSFLMHLVALLAIYFIFNFLNKNIRNRFVFSGIWLFVGVGYFFIFLIPTMVISYYFVGFINHGELFANYLKIIELIRFEVVSTTAVTMLFLLNLKTTEILKNQNSELKVSMQKSEESERLKTAFLQNLSHEIRTPMNGILGFSRLIQFNNHDNADTQKYIQHIVNSGEQLLTIVNDIIDASQIATKQIKLTESENSLETIFTDLTAVFKMKTELNGSRIISSINCSGDIIIRTDVYKVSRTIIHLLDNALKFSNDMPVELDINLIDGYLEVSVKDYGIGIQANDSEFIFGGFRQLDTESTRSYGGNGLGLTIAKGFVDFLAGTIWFTSEVGRGSTFFIKIPVGVVMVGDENN